MTDEPKYTLDEARHQLALRQCAVHGHDLSFLMTMSSIDPTGAVCDSCGARFTMARVQ